MILFLVFVMRGHFAFYHKWIIYLPSDFLLKKKKKNNKNKNGMSKVKSQKAKLKITPSEFCQISIQPSKF